MLLTAAAPPAPPAQLRGMPALRSLLPASLLSGEPERDGNASARPPRCWSDLRAAGKGPVTGAGRPQPRPRRGAPGRETRGVPPDAWARGIPLPSLSRCCGAGNGAGPGPAPALATAAVATDAAVAGAELPRVRPPAGHAWGSWGAGARRAEGSRALARGLPAARVCGAARSSRKGERRDLGWRSPVTPPRAAAES